MLSFPFSTDFILKPQACISSILFGSAESQKISCFLSIPKFSSFQTIDLSLSLGVVYTFLNPVS
jgi:hypothetical protein